MVGLNVFQVRRWSEDIDAPRLGPATSGTLARVGKSRSKRNLLPGSVCHLEGVCVRKFNTYHAQCRTRAAEQIQQLESFMPVILTVMAILARLHHLCPLLLKDLSTPPVAALPSEQAKAASTGLAEAAPMPQLLQATLPAANGSTTASPVTLPNHGASSNTGDSAKSKASTAAAGTTTDLSRTKKHESNAIDSIFGKL
jgi:hypothetical protein